MIPFALVVGAFRELDSDFWSAGTTKTRRNEKWTDKSKKWATTRKKVSKRKKNNRKNLRISNEKTHTRLAEIDQ
jgi:hypothetical protein